MMNLGIVYGGKSDEHEVSIASAKNIMQALDKSKYKIKVIKISRDGTFYKVKNSTVIKTNLCDLNLDVVFPVLHGPFGEDGKIQGMFESLNIPYVGSNVLSSAICMDKDISKKLLKYSKVNVANFITLKEKIQFEKVKEKLNLPFYIKPANLGSSIGISKAETKEEFDNALELAFKYDKKILIEEEIKGRELECCVIGNDDIKISRIGEIKVNNSFYSYNLKYSENTDVELVIPAMITEKTSEKIKKMAKEVYKILECKGMARIDFFLTKENKLYVNEVNTIPGFTDSSMFPKLWEQSGISISELIDKLIDFAISKN